MNTESDEHEIGRMEQLYKLVVIQDGYIRLLIAEISDLNGRATYPYPEYILDLSGEERKYRAEQLENMVSVRSNCIRLLTKEFDELSGMAASHDGWISTRTEERGKARATISDLKKKLGMTTKGEQS